MIPQQQSRCPHCGARANFDDTHCARCGGSILPTAQTTQLTRRPFALPMDSNGGSVFGADVSAILQVFPSGTCLSLQLRQPIILGRGASTERQKVVDLSEFNALDHGVSRLHCRLQRHENHLVIMDLGSANGTYVNGEPLLPHHVQILHHGDKLILGTLHMLVSFSPG
jgi:hypothetical protein